MKTPVYPKATKQLAIKPYRPTHRSTKVTTAQLSSPVVRDSVSRRRSLCYLSFRPQPSRSCSREAAVQPVQTNILLFASSPATSATVPPPLGRLPDHPASWHRQHATAMPHLNVIVVAVFGRGQRVLVGLRTGNRIVVVNDEVGEGAF
jgi:hypothetical protein